MLAVPLTNIFDTAQVNLGSAYVNYLNLYGRTFQVRAQADDKSRGHIEDIGRLKTRNASGGMLPLGSVVNVRWETRPDRVVGYNMHPSAQVQGDTAPGFSSAHAIPAARRLPPVQRP